MVFQVFLAVALFTVITYLHNRVTDLHQAICLRGVVQGVLEEGVAHTISLNIVSAVAGRIDKTVSEEPFVVHHPCEGEIFCHVKPDNYPQEEIDRIVMEHLPRLHRMKRDAPLPSARIDPNGNCAVKEVGKVKPFTVKLEDHIPKLVLQSNWFEQTVHKVICSTEGMDCFQSLTLNFADVVRARCRNKKLLSSLVVYNHASKQPENATIEIDIDCECAVERN